PGLVAAPRADELLAQGLIAELVAVVARRGVGLHVDDVRALHRLATIRRLGDATAGLRRGLTRLVHDRGGQLEAGWPQVDDVHAALRGHVQRRRGHGEWQRARVVAPRQHELAIFRDGELVERLPVGEAL